MHRRTNGCARGEKEIGDVNLAFESIVGDTYAILI